MLRPLLAGLACALVAGIAVGCDSKDPNANTADAKSTLKDTAKAPPPPDTSGPTPSGPMEATDTTGKKFTFADPGVQKGDVAVVETSMGTIKFTLDDKTPNHVANFEKLANAGFYDGTAFHRVVPHFMIQGGDPNTRSKSGPYGGGDPGYKIKSEFNSTPFERGIVGMARSQDVDSAGSQFFIMVDSNPGLNNQYTAFGKVTEGMDVADKIVAVPTDGDAVKDIDKVRIKSVKIVHPAK